MRALTDNDSPTHRKLLQDIEDNGVHIVHVPADDDGPAFTFTVGLWHSFEQPEVIVFGLQQEVAADLLNALADEAAEGKTFLADSRHEGLLVGYPLRFLEVPKDQYAGHFGMALWAYEGDDFPGVQMVWPDKQGRWPWEPGLREGFAQSQPVIGRKSS